MKAALVAENITKCYPTRGEPLVVLRDASLRLAPGDRAAIMGPSGSGKSTLLNVLGTLEPPTSGTLRLGDADPLALDERALARFRNRQVGFIFQEHHLLPHCSVLENVLVPTLVTRSDPGADAAEGAGRAREASRLARAKQLLARVGLSDRLDHRPAELSGGERQRVAVARALINRPALVLADEPTGNLDSVTADAVTNLLLEIATDENVILVFVTHSAELAGRFEKRYDIRDGQLNMASK